MLVIARDLGQKIDRKDAFKGEDGKYYSSQDACDRANLRKNLKITDKMEKEARILCIDKMFEFMRYDKTDRMPSLFFGRLKVWSEKWGYNYRYIYEAMCLADKSIQRTWNTKEFDSDINRLFYFMSIIQNLLNDGKREFLRKQRLTEEARKNEVVAEVDTEVGVSGHKGKIIQLFGDEEWT